MNKRENPYTPGAGRKPPVLAGRDPDLENVALIERLSGGGYERSLVYSGLRGVGKTVLLMEFDVLASETGWATTDVQEVGSQPASPRRRATAVTDSSLSRYSRIASSRNSGDHFDRRPTTDSSLPAPAPSIKTSTKAGQSQPHTVVIAGGGPTGLVLAGERPFARGR